ncbi:hypothetical protein LO762_26465 [Actinocorallia sp. API 0066]|uniref:hypothetical protein n=1 Tax=Actinocorallia sp. API 0066 TaxID=2896846 RepID=UPI001E4CF634|nr:hypothetical protein [Actinocorallia sp. API 0066]MCD0452699.1 hypothetical protein [Actinocorallia sp. API 0066]
MKKLLRRAAISAAAVAAALALAPAAPATAENPYTPSEADFATCPPKPAGATAWTCFVSTVVDGTIEIGSIRVLVDKPVRLVTAQGKLADGSTVARVGSLTSGELTIQTPLLGTPIYTEDLTGTKVRIESTGSVVAGTVMPKEFGVKFRFLHPLMIGNCYVGTDAAPITVKPRIGLALPEVRQGLLMARVWTTDNAFALPKANGCGLIPGGLVDLIVNDRFKLPNKVGDNKAAWNWIVRHKDL